MAEEKHKQEVIEQSDTDYGKVPSYYSNSVRLVTTTFDFRLLFGEISPFADGKMGVIARATVVMSPEHMKAMVAVLTRSVEEFEDAHGVIPWPAKPAQKPA